MGLLSIRSVFIGLGCKYNPPVYLSSFAKIDNGTLSLLS